MMRKCVHGNGFACSFFSNKNYPDFIDEINKFLSKELGARFSKKIKKREKNEFDEYLCT